MISNTGFEARGVRSFPGRGEDFEVLHIVTALTLGNFIYSTSMFFFSEKAYCIVSKLCEPGKERG